MSIHRLQKWLRPARSGRSLDAIRRYTRSVSEQLDLTIVYEDGGDGFTMASIPAVPGVLSQGRSREEARANVLDALALMLSPEPPEAGDQRERELLHLKVS